MGCLRWGLVCAIVWLTAQACSTSSSSRGENNAGTSGSSGNSGGSGRAGSSGRGGTSGEGGSSGDGGNGGSGGTSGTGSGASGGTAGTGMDGGTPCNPMATPGAGVFAAPSGSDTAGDGSMDLPVASIARALEVAAATGQTTVYLSQGTYPEAVKFLSRHAGIFIEGGWASTGAAWSRDCSADARKKTLIASPTAVGIQVEQLAMRSGLRSLSVATKAAGTSAANTAGESCYGVLVTGSNTLFSLEDTAVKAGNGGNGGDATAVVAGLKASCSDLVNGCGNGANGTAGGNGGDALAGTFSASGYVPGDGQPGAPGNFGRNGTAGTQGQQGSCFLQEGCNCDGASTNCGAIGNRMTKYGGHGTCGCGGDGGNAGSAGRGGGASVGVFASGSGVIVSVTGGTITAGNGGNGTAGGPSAAGTNGRAGAAGTAANCAADCVKNGAGVNCVNDGCRQTGSTLTGGTAGGTGGNGASGGRGGGGAGGPSYGVVALGGASVLVNGGSLMPGMGGPGGGTAPAGLAGERYAP